MFFFFPLYRVNNKGNYCHLEACYPYTDLDLATDETGVWVVYTTTGDHGNLVLARVGEEEGRPTLGQTWHTSLYKNSASNSFVAFGVLYATRYVSADAEEVFYSFDTATGAACVRGSVYDLLQGCVWVASLVCTRRRHNHILSMCRK